MFENFSEDVLRLASSLESNLEHPIARGIAESAVKRGIKLLPVENFTALLGRGVVASRTLKVVSPGYLVENGIELESKDSGGTVIGAIALADIIRDDQGRHRRCG